MNLRPYQLEALHGDGKQWPGIFQALQEHRSTLLVQPTGTGKTEVAFAAASQFVNDGLVVMLADRRSLVHQTAARAAEAGFAAAVEMAEEQALPALPDCRGFISACVPSLQGDRLSAYQRAPVRLVIIDEADLAAADSYARINAAFPRAKVLGMTATPERLDGQPLPFESIAYRYALRTAILDGWLADIVPQKVVVEKLDVSQVRKQGGDLAQQSLCEAMLAVAVPTARRIVQATTEARRKHTMIFSTPGRAPDEVLPELADLGIEPGVSNAHGLALTRAINRFAGCRAAFVSGDNEPDHKGIEAEFRAGAITHLVNCQLWVRGKDIPCVDCVIPRLTISWALYMQMIGRGTRRSPETGKTDCRVFDLVGNTGRHTMIEPSDLAGEGMSDAKAAELGKRIRQLQATDPLLGLAAAARQAEWDMAAAERQAVPEQKDFYLKTVNPWIADQLRRPRRGPDATPEQMRFLANLGVEPPDMVDRSTASALIGKLKPLRDAGPPSERMKQCVVRYQIDPSGMTWAEAYKRIDELKGSRR